jgi:hypothetical protein
MPVAPEEEEKRDLPSDVGMKRQIFNPFRHDIGVKWQIFNSIIEDLA